MSRVPTVGKWKINRINPSCSEGIYDKFCLFFYSTFLQALTSFQDISQIQTARVNKAQMTAIMRKQINQEGSISVLITIPQMIVGQIIQIDLENIQVALMAIFLKDEKVFRDMTMK